jgi:pimeloyl-ACP methyl ester carboxylesterase
MKRIIVVLSVVLAALVIHLPAQAALKDLQIQAANVNGVRIAWAEVGNPEGTPVLMIMGLGASHQVWGDPMISGLVKEGYRVILMDNRDVGGSQKFSDQGQPVIWWNLLKNQLGFSVTTAYTLEDMARDAVALLDELDLESAHIVGASMGGMIAQIIAARYPQRARSLVSIMSTTGAPHLPDPGQDDSNRIEDLASSGEERIQELNDVGFYPSAIPRHIMAVLDAGDRTESVKTIGVKTLVIHGVEDTLLSLPHGKHTAEVIPRAEFVAFEGMGHDIPAPVLPKLLERMRVHIAAAESEAS